MGPGKRDFTKPIQPGLIWTESRQQRLTPQFTRESKGKRYFILSCIIIISVFFIVSLTLESHVLSCHHVLCRPTPTSIHLPGSIVFPTVRFLFPVLAAHAALPTCTYCHSSPRFSPCSSCRLYEICACSWRCNHMFSISGPSLVFRLSCIALLFWCMHLELSKR